MLRRVPLYITVGMSVLTAAASTASLSTPVSGASLAKESATGSATASTSAGGDARWISAPESDVLARPVVLHFRRTIPRTGAGAFRVRVSADNHFILYVNGVRVADGPSTADLRHWRYAVVDLAPFLKPGTNTLSATVWNYVRESPPPLPSNASDAARGKAWATEMMVQTGRLAQQSAGAGFWLAGDGRAASIGTGRPGWEVAVDRGRGARSGASQLGLARYYVASAAETTDTRTAIDLRDPATIAHGQWQSAVPAPGGGAHDLQADPLPPQRFVEVPAGKVVRISPDRPTGFPLQSLVVPANNRITLLIRRDAMVSAYPELSFSGGRDAKIAVTYAEAMYDAKGHKGDRDAIVGRKPVGITDTIVADGARHAVMPLWWRTWRFLQVDVETGDAPLTLERLRTWETGYPFEARGYFHSDDPALDRIWQIGWRTALIDAHDTYMDSAYWEQLQYVGDTRLQMLLSYGVSGDPRLARQAIDAFAGSDVDDGLVEGAWPSRGTNSIAPFSLLWVGMLHDWWQEQPDTATIQRNLPRMRRILAWFEPWQTRRLLLRKNPQWNFIDWVGQNAADRSIFPSYGRDGESCLTSIVYLGALDQAADLEAALGKAATGRADRTRATALRDAIQQHCYSPQRKLYADNPDLTVFSQHMNALAVLHDVAKPAEARDILDRIVSPGKGIDAPAGMSTTSYYFAWYLVRAFEHAGMATRYPALLKTWRDLLTLNYTTWPEERGETRSDTHAWSAHPTADLLRLVAGIGPGAPGYRSVRIAPALGALTKLDAAAMTPSGLVGVRYRVEGLRMTVDIRSPRALPGWFEWKGRRLPLTGGHTRLTVDSPVSLPRDGG